MNGKKAHTNGDRVNTPLQNTGRGERGWKGRGERGRGWGNWGQSHGVEGDETLHKPLPESSNTPSSGNEHETSGCEFAGDSGSLSAPPAEPEPQKVPEVADESSTPPVSVLTPVSTPESGKIRRDMLWIGQFRAISSNIVWLTHLLVTLLAAAKDTSSSQQPPMPNETTTENNTVPVGDPSSTSEHYIEAVSYIYVFILFVLTCILPATRVMLYTETESEVWKSMTYLAAPISCAALAASIFLQPRNNMLVALLFFEAFLVLVLPDVIKLIDESSSVGITVSLMRVSFGLWLFRFFLSVKARIARLPAKRLSRFLTDSLLVTLFIFLGFEIFFALDPIRCWLENPDKPEICER